MRKPLYLNIIFLYAFLSCQKEQQQNNSGTSLTQNNIVADKSDLKEMRQKASEALQFCKKKKLNTDFCILIDMSVHSGLKRFFMWDFKKILFLQHIL